jgi:hypothetical protein
MSIGKQMIEQLRRLAQGEAIAQEDGDRKTLAVPGDGPSARLEFYDIDRYSVTMRAVEIGAPLAPADARAFLSPTAAEIARRLAFLEEPLAVWELDGAERVAQLRSSPPLREGDEVSYWEVELWTPANGAAQSGARATRYHWSPGMVEREVVAYPATFGLVGRIADGLAEALTAEYE